MADRENVITHFRDAIEASGDGNKWRFVRVDILEEAIELLKEQEPTKTKASAAEPIKRVWTKSIEYVCAACSHKVGLRYRGRDIWYFRDDECKNCGRSVKWE